MRIEEGESSLPVLAVTTTISSSLVLDGKTVLHDWIFNIFYWWWTGKK
jgi:hypothetical protein